MLTYLNSQIILQFQHNLESLQSQLKSLEVDPKVIQHQLEQVQQLFEHQIMRLNSEVYSPTVPKWQSYLTETHKQMRLLVIDCRRLQASRQGKTAQIRQTQMINRLGTLIGYCQAILALSEAE